MITTIDKEADFTGAVALKKETRGMLFALSINPVVPKGNRYKLGHMYTILLSQEAFDTETILKLELTVISWKRRCARCETYKAWADICV